MGYRIEAQSPNEVENIRQRVRLQEQVVTLNEDVQKTSSINPQIAVIRNLLQRNLEEQANLDDIYYVTQDTQNYLEYKLNEIYYRLNNQLNDVSFVLEDNVVNQTDLDEIYKYVKNTRANVNKKLNALNKQIDEQNKKMDKIIELLEKDK